MRKGRVEEAGAIASRIGKLVAKANSVLLKDLGTRSSTKELWSRVNKTRKTTTAHVPPSGITAETLNNHYAAISNDPLYIESLKRHTAQATTQLVTEQSIFYILDHLHCTAEGWDQVPAWFYGYLPQYTHYRSLISSIAPSPPPTCLNNGKLP